MPFTISIARAPVQSGKAGIVLTGQAYDKAAIFLVLRRARAAWITIDSV
jgi:hypothetical protein